jgi:hypothetical protein
VHRGDLPALASAWRSPARRDDHVGPRPRNLGISCCCRCLCRRDLGCRLKGEAILATRFGQRHSACRSRPARGDSTGFVCTVAGEIPRRDPGDRLRAGAGPRRADRPDGRRHRCFRGARLPALLGRCLYTPFLRLSIELALSMFSYSLLTRTISLPLSSTLPGQIQRAKHLPDSLRGV